MKPKTLTLLILTAIVMASVACSVGPFKGVINSQYVKRGNCESFGKHLVGGQFQNDFGRTWEILKIYRATEISRTETAVSCKGQARTTGGDIDVLYSVQIDEDGDFWWKSREDVPPIFEGIY